MGVSRTPTQQARRTWNGIGCLSSIVKNAFENISKLLKPYMLTPNYVDLANDGITSILQDTEIDIGIRWEKGRFLQSGAPVLDEKLVNDVLGIPRLQSIGVSLIHSKKDLTTSNTQPDETRSPTADVHDMPCAAKAFAINRLIPSDRICAIGNP